MKGEDGTGYRKDTRDQQMGQETGYGNVTREQCRMNRTWNRVRE